MFSQGGHLPPLLSSRSWIYFWFYLHLYLYLQYTFHTQEQILKSIRNYIPVIAAIQPCSCWLSLALEVYVEEKKIECLSTDIISRSSFISFSIWFNLSCSWQGYQPSVTKCNKTKPYLDKNAKPSHENTQHIIKKWLLTAAYEREGWRQRIFLIWFIISTGRSHYKA